MKKLLIIVLLLLLASPAWGAYALIDSVAVGNDPPDGLPGKTSGSIVTTGADLLTCVQTNYAAYGGTPTDSEKNTWTALTENLHSDATIRVYYATNVGAKTSATHTFSTAGYYASMICSAWSGSHTTAPADQELATAYTPYGDNLRDLATGSITPTQNSELIIVGCAVYDLAASSGSINGGFTILNQVNAVGGGNVGSFAAYLIQTSATAANPICSWAGQNSVAAVIASFKVPAGAPTRRPIAPMVFQ